MSGDTCVNKFHGDNCFIIYIYKIITLYILSTYNFISYISIKLGRQDKMETRGLNIIKRTL